MNKSEMIKRTIEGIDKSEFSDEEKRILKMIADSSIRSDFKKGVGERELKTKKETIEKLFKLRLIKYKKTNFDTFWRIQKKARIDFCGSDDTLEPEKDQNGYPSDAVSISGECVICHEIAFISPKTRTCTRCWDKRREEYLELVK